MESKRAGNGWRSFTAESSGLIVTEKRIKRTGIFVTGKVRTNDAKGPRVRLDSAD